MSQRKIWVTKYALTEGVYLCEGEIDDGMAIVKWKGGLNDRAYFHGRDFHLSENDAAIRVTEMIKAKRKTIEKQLARLRDIERSSVLVKEVK